jgi:hypothetical protein
MAAVSEELRQVVECMEQAGSMVGAVVDSTAGKQEVELWVMRCNEARASAPLFCAFK